MASGDVVGVGLQADHGPFTLFAPLVQVSGGSTPAERTLAWAFDDSTQEYKDFRFFLYGYDGGGLTITLVYTSATETSGSSETAEIGIALRALVSDTDNLSTAHTYDYNYANLGAPSAALEVMYSSAITFSSGADMDSAADGQEVLLRVTRDATDGTNDTWDGDFYLIDIIVKET